MVTNWLCVYIVVSITPVGTTSSFLPFVLMSLMLISGIDSIGWRFYIIFAVLNLSWIPLIWFFYVETAGLSLEEIDRVFELKHAPGAKMTYAEAAKQAREDIESERLQLRDPGSEDKEPTSEYVEQVA